MVCAKCGTEIADKALVCYRCGSATHGAAPPRATARPRGGNSLLSLLTLTLLATGALLIARAVRGEVPDELRWVVLVLAIVVLAWRAILRWRGRRGL
jgi:hypothetical protein